MKLSEAAFVSSASVAAELAGVSGVARDMSLSVKNAKAIANRAGSKARGFSPITDFIDEMSVETMKLVSRINENSIKLSGIAINELRIQETVNSFEKVLKDASDAKYIDSLKQSMANVKKMQDAEQANLHKFSRALKDLMGDIAQYMAVANVIVSNSRIEAVNAEEYRANLESIANDIEASCDTIRERVKKSQHRLENAMQQWKREFYHESS
ncbi:MAG TPA: chemotaxis protein [Gammaproteobacteria bacterium]|nr:chemotaxis protein [Gammaproteobacteria bacterium]